MSMVSPVPVTLLFTRSSRRLWSWGLGELLAGLDERSLPELLLVTGNHADAHALTARAGDVRWGTTFLPRIVTLEGLLLDLCARGGAAHAPLPLEAHALLADALITGSPGRWEWLARLQTHGAVGQQVARLHLRWWQAERPSLARMGAFRGALLDDLLQALDERIASLPGHRPLPMLLQQLQARLGAPADPLT